VRRNIGINKPPPHRSRESLVSSSSLPAFETPDTLVTAIAQDMATGKVLMVAHMNQAAWEQTLATGQAMYYSRSRRRLWKKGEHSGHVQRVREIYIDCDGDAVLLKVEQVGAACHEGYESCFFRRQADGQWEVVGQRIFDPKTVYGND
jgi:phosphoribosyl-AMP cyclohydrolase